MNKVLGVDIDQRSIRLALVGNGKKPKLIKTVEIPVSLGTIDDQLRFVNEDADLTLKEAIKKNKMHAGKIAVNLRAGMAREFSFQNVKEKELRSALELDMSSTIHDISVSYQLNYKIYEKSKTEIKGLVAFCPHKYIESALSYQDKLPGQVRYIDVYPNTLCKALQYTLKDNPADENLMVIDVGYKESILTVIQNKRVVISRVVNTGAYQLDKLVSDEFSESLESAEASRKTYYKSYFERGIDMERFIRVAYKPIQVDALQARTYCQKKGCPPTNILLIGEGVDVPSFDLYIRESFNLPARMLSSSDGKGMFIENYHKMLPAIGAAIREE